MNLADAIRHAASHQGEAPKFSAACEIENPTLELVDSNDSEAAPTQELSPMKDQILHAEAPTQGNVVRLEVVLTAEQLKALFSSIVASQHSVMTVREAASFLRLPVHSVEQLAGEGKLPAFQLDGKWRFLHTALDEWLASRQHEEPHFDQAVGA